MFNEIINVRERETSRAGVGNVSADRRLKNRYEDKSW